MQMFYNFGTSIQKMNYKVSGIVQATPAMQMPVERAFSTLKLILSDLRASIDEDLLETFFY